MKLNRGCSCLTIILAAINVFILISVFIGMAQGKTSVSISLGMIAIFLANVVVCSLAGLASLRTGGTPTSAEGGEGEDVAESEGEDE